MKILTLIDSSTVKSFYVKNKKAYEMKTDLPYVRTQSIGNECFMSIFEYPFLSDGYYVTWSEWEELPDLDVDVVLLSIEKKIGTYNVEQVRKKYPNAVIIGILKELAASHRNRVEFFEKCDTYVLPIIDKKLHDCYSKDVGIESKFLAQPYDVTFLYDKYYLEERNDSIFSYIVPGEYVRFEYGNEIQQGTRRGNTEMFANKMASKFNLPIIRTETRFESGTQWPDFLKILSEQSFCFNLDPIQSTGQQAVQCAALGVINVGGNNDIQKHLYPDLSGTDLVYLEEKFTELVNDVEKRVQYITDAFNNAVKIYSLKSVYTEIENIIKGI